MDIGWTLTIGRVNVIAICGDNTGLFLLVRGSHRQTAKDRRKSLGLSLFFSHIREITHFTWSEMDHSTQTTWLLDITNDPKFA